MYAVIKSGGQQYRVQTGQTLKVAKIVADVGKTVDLDKVLMVVDGDKFHIGKPFLEKHVVKASIVSHGRHDKVHILKFRRRKHHMKRMGHRQDYTEIKITEIK